MYDLNALEIGGMVYDPNALESGGTVYNLSTLESRGTMYDMNVLELGSTVYYMNALESEGMIYKLDALEFRDTIYDLNALKIKGTVYDLNSLDIEENVAPKKLAGHPFVINRTQSLILFPSAIRMEASSVALLLASLLFSAASAVDYTATNNAGGTPGGARFDSEIGLDYGKQVLADASSFCWSIFQQPTEADRRSVQRIALIVESMDGVAYNSNDEIHLSADYVAGYSGDVRTEITGVLYHEVTHSWQWNGRGAANGGLIEGIADFVRLKAGYAPGHWVGPGGGDRWDQGYDVTARFLDYCEGLMAGFVAQLNAKMRDGYSDDFFQQLLGKTVDQLWTDYKAQYSG
ncbi:uncharacterized protein LOC122048209 [Zingiber officinale]|uniref:uncharacterized protein LOC122048209 n=1 Tax=Zingiber officinale TaxID=94328 RepID=UPI001C4C7E07|nr:uncharacterized protein LOC122048209 [Zingiber officinale]